MKQNIEPPLTALLSAIKQLPPVPDLALDSITLADITRLKGGLCNVNLRLDGASQSYLIRFMRHRDNITSTERNQELARQSIAAQHQLAPDVIRYWSIEQLVRFGPKTWLALAELFDGVTIHRYCPGHSMAANADLSSAQLDRLADLLAALHQIDIPTLKHQAKQPINSVQRASQRLQHYWQLYCAQQPEPSLAKHSLECEMIDQIITELGQLSLTDDCLVHGDVNPGNVITNTETLRLIDWEYSALDQPYIDLASTIVEFELTGEAVQQFINRYQDASKVIDWHNLDVYQSYYCALCWLWHQINQQGLGLESTSDISQRYYQQWLAAFDRLK